MSEGMQLWAAQGLALPENPCNPVPLYFVLCWAPTWEFNILFCQICKKAFQYWHFLKWFVLKVSKGKPSAHPLSAWQGGFSHQAPPSPSLSEASGTTSPVRQTQMHQNPCASSHALHCSPTSALHHLPSLRLPKSKNPLPWLKLQSGCILPEINKLRLNAPIAGRQGSPALEEPLSHLLAPCWTQK